MRAAGGATAAALGAALLLGAAGPAVAHPHGSLDCAAQLLMGPNGLDSLQLTLTLDTASSASLQPRLQADAQGQPPADRQARLFGDLLAGMFRQSGWMLRLQPLDADGGLAEPLALVDPGPAVWRRNPQGQIEVSVRLQPDTTAAVAAGPPPPTRYRLACQDPVWYWATGFAGPAQLTVNPPCQAQLDAMGSLADQAQALQAAARRAGVAGADQAAPGLLSTPVQRAPAALLTCAAP